MDSRGQGALISTAPTHVIDANIIVKWILQGEPYEEQAFKLIKNLRVGVFIASAPAFIVHEVVNSLWKATKLKRITLDEACEALKSLDDIPINLYEMDWTAALSELTVASELDIATYDAAYLALSEKIKAPVITADDKLYQKAKGRFRVLHLKDYQ